MCAVLSSHLGRYKKSLRSRSAKGSLGFLGFWLAGPGESWDNRKHRSSCVDQTRSGGHTYLNMHVVFQDTMNLFDMDHIQVYCACTQIGLYYVCVVGYRCSWCSGSGCSSSHPSEGRSHQGLSHHRLPHHGLHHGSSGPSCRRLVRQHGQHNRLGRCAD